MIQPQTGDRISNYLLESPIGAGSFGQVWQARHHVLDQVVAIKTLTDPQYVRNFRQEGVVVHGIRHPNIVRVLDIDPYADVPYMVMELVEGPSLRHVIDDHRQGMDIDLAVRIMRGVLAGLQVAHENKLVHRDVKPANILLRTPQGGLSQVCEGDVKLTDFGLGRTTHVTAVSLMQSGSLATEDGASIAGTINYMSPEQRQGDPIDHRSDLFSCGVVLFEMLTGTRPAGSDLPSMVRPEVPSYLDEVFRRSYTRLERRFASASAMLAALTLPAGRGGKWASAVPIGADSDPDRVHIAGSSMASCSQCGQSVHGDDNFCIHCGHQMVTQVPRCGACRAFVNRGDRFCIFCGEKLGDDSD